MKKSYEALIDEPAKKAFFVDPELNASAELVECYLPIFTRQDGSKYVDCPGPGRWDVEDVGAVGEDAKEMRAVRHTEPLWHGAPQRLA